MLPICAAKRIIEPSDLRKARAGESGMCDDGKNAAKRCWYNSIIEGLTDESFSRVDFSDGPGRIVAAPPEPYRIGRHGRTGFLTLSNVVERDGNLYFFAYAERDGGSGKNCLFRRSHMMSGQWLALGEIGFDQAFLSPYERPVGSPAPHCAGISTEHFTQPIRSLLYLETEKTWVAAMKLNRKVSGRIVTGVFVSFSENLVEWTPLFLLIELPYTTEGDRCRTFYEYPSMIDHSSPSALFDTAGSSFYLYMTRFNWEKCMRPEDRDLVRIKVQVAK